MQRNNWTILELYEVLKERIQSGDYVPGQKINQSELSKEFNVSRTPVIKALGMLQAEELVDNIPQKGYFVHTLTVKNVLEMYQLRVVMDQIIVKDIVRNIKDVEVDELEALFLPFVGQKEIDIGEYARADMKFHRRLYEISKNHVVIKLQQYFGISYRYYRAGFAFPAHETLPAHLEIIEALRTRNLELTTELISQHANMTKEKIELLYESLLAIGRDPEMVSIGEFQL